MDRASIPGRALILILALIFNWNFRLQLLCTCTYMMLVENRHSKRILKLQCFIFPASSTFLTHTEHLHRAVDTAGESDSKVKILSGKRKTEVLNVHRFHIKCCAYVLYTANVFPVVDVPLFFFNFYRPWQVNIFKQGTACVIWGFPCEVDEIYALLGYYAAWNYHYTLHNIPEEHRS